jgi:hypothetical protein
MKQRAQTDVSPSEQESSSNGKLLPLRAQALYDVVHFCAPVGLLFFKVTIYRFEREL